MDQPTKADAVPEERVEEGPEDRAPDPFVVALANASLLSAGYLALGRRKLAVATGLVTIALLALLVTVFRTWWFDAIVLLWWAGLIWHGWFLAGGRGPRPALLALTLPVLLVVGLMRFDAARIEGTVAEARAAGDCARAVNTLEQLWFGHRLVDPAVIVRGALTDEACRRARTAKDKLTLALTGRTDVLKEGFDGLAFVLAELRGHEKIVDVVLDGFLAGLPAKNPCHTAVVTDWLRERKPAGNALDRSSAVVARTAPAALVACGDELMTAKDWQRARQRFQQLLDLYPGHELTAKAQEGVKQATLAMELANVRGLLRGSVGSQPAYCARPAQYSGAPAYGKGTNRALIYGNSEYANKLPAEWKAGDAADAVLVVCAGSTEFGAAVRSCPYQSKLNPRIPVQVTFHKIVIPVKAYELRTGKQVTDTKIEIDGSTCPRVLTYTRSRLLADIGPPSQVHVIAPDSTVHAAFGSFINQ
ncbi:2TM domain-containing protein [Allokutzneria sp. A3M-2-11 16]|uniref:2TM domain-containing protein n=1 Tax=Allokutzneria sp. A3M-2-11 16 TaxID=2962043 RepID=UPI0020B7801F|nr:2TM domain-containing protein [Allokutzneria sp. A3M-2-11 16]MCP3804115.1 2TM domain-containing protein [Allokutzneria sp. A3M-2-11 16]